jgi:hypothetical protein
VSFDTEVARANRIRTRRHSVDLFSERFADADTVKDLAMVPPSYTFAPPIFGAQANVGLTAVYGRNRTIQNVLVSDLAVDGPFARPRSRFEMNGDSVTGFGDLSPQVTLRWNSGAHNFMTYATGNIPVGAYNPSRLANIGIGHSALDGGLGYTYLDDAGREFSAVAGVTYNFLNPFTQYQNGTDFHLDWGASQFFFSKQLQIGVVGYVYNQLTCDSGSGNKVGCFDSRVASVGAQLGYTITVGELEAYVNLRGYNEFDAANRPEGWNVWLTLTLSPADTASTKASTKRTRQNSY